MTCVYFLNLTCDIMENKQKSISGPKGRGALPINCQPPPPPPPPTPLNPPTTGDAPHNRKDHVQDLNQRVYKKITRSKHCKSDRSHTPVQLPTKRSGPGCHKMSNGQQWVLFLPCVLVMQNSSSPTPYTCGTKGLGGGGLSRDLKIGDDALSTKPVMLIWAPLIPATRWSCSQQSLLSVGGRLQLHLVAGIRGAQISITQVMYRSASSPNIRSLHWDRPFNRIYGTLDRCCPTHALRRDCTRAAILGWNSSPYPRMHCFC